MTERRAKRWRRRHTVVMTPKDRAGQSYCLIAYDDIAEYSTKLIAAGCRSIGRLVVPCLVVPRSSPVRPGAAGWAMTLGRGVGRV